MSDFDKEAEREKLREKYERDKADREATQRMSDLLLKGATMTNTHCDVCGDPYFQQDGVTFCPTCHGGPDGVEASAQDDQSAAPAPEADAAESDAAQSAGGPPPADAESGDATTSIDVDTPAQSTPETGADPSTSEAGRSDPSRPADANTGAAQPPRSVEGTDSTAEARSPARRPSSADRGGSAPSTDRVGGDLETARAALIDSLEKYASEAAATDDPRYAKECLEAAREAAAALSALR